MNNRRKLIVVLGAGALKVPFGSFAQQPTARIYRIGFLGTTSAAGIETNLEALRAGLRDLGYVEGKNLVIEFRWAEGKYDRLPRLAEELVRINVELIVTHATPGVRAAKQATTVIPIVMAASGDAVANGLVNSLARPGGNITGSTFFQPELVAKRLEQFKDAFPHITQIAYVTNPENSANSGPTLRATEAAGKSLKMRLQRFDVRGLNDFDGIISAMRKKQINAILFSDETVIMSNAKAIADLAIKHHVLTVGNKRFAEDGGLMGYGSDTSELYRRAATYIDKILKGAKPADLPVEQPTKFELVVNMKTAKTLGLTIPQPFLMRANRVIE